jgi:hypothetical protein
MADFEAVGFNVFDVQVQFDGASSIGVWYVYFKLHEKDTFSERSGSQITKAEAEKWADDLKAGKIKMTVERGRKYFTRDITRKVEITTSTSGNTLIVKLFRGESEVAFATYQNIDAPTLRVAMSQFLRQDSIHDAFEKTVAA